jgi:serine protease
VPLHRFISILLGAAAVMLTGGSTALAAPYRADQVIVKYAAQASRAQTAAVQQATGTGAAGTPAPAPQTQVLAIRDGDTVRHTVHELDRQPGVEYAVPNYVAHAAGLVPNDPGRARQPGGWQLTQWNFLAGAGVDAPTGWANLVAAGAPGGRGVTVAVLDTGVAYENRGRFRRSPDLGAASFVPGYDFVASDTRPDDENGHGTFIASVLAEQTDNGRDLTGLAYGARVMPVRVLDADGLGDAASIGRGIRFAARHGAKVINLSLEFDPSTPRSQIPEVLSAIRYAHNRGVVVVAASGNEAEASAAYPAKAGNVISVGATTEHGCLADYSNTGAGLDIVAPGGGSDADLSDDPVHCRPASRPGRDIYQLTFTGSSPRRFGLPSGYQGTSMATPHVAGVAALVIASRVIGRDPSPKAVEQRLEATARDLGTPGYDARYGFGMVDAGRATAPPVTAAGRHRRH